MENAWRMGDDGTRKSGSKDRPPHPSVMREVREDEGSRREETAEKLERGAVPTYRTCSPGYLPSITATCCFWLRIR